MSIATMMHMPMLFRSRRAAAHLVAIAAVAAALGCSTDQLLTVDDVDTATPISVQTKAALPVLLAGAVGDVQGAYSGFGTDAQITQSAEFTDEFEFVETFPSRQEFDQRSIQLQNGTNTTIFRNLMRGYASAVRTQEAYARLDPRVPGHAQAYNLMGFAIILAGENYCSGVPFSKLTEAGEAVYGEPMTRDAMFTYALAVADSAIGVLDAMPVTTASTLQRNFALVLKGRALVNLKRFADAATAVAAVPTNFVVQFQHSDNTVRENNGIFGLTFLDPRMSVANVEGGNGLPFRADADPRVPQRRGTGVGGEPSVGFDGSPMYLQLKYLSRSANTTVVSGIEARLIEAEAKLDASDGPGALLILNALRAPTGPGSGGVAGLAPLVDAGTPAGRVDQLFKERAYWLWLTSHRLGDLRRLVRQYGRGAESVFPTGAYLKGGLYGTDVNFPVPNDELNNPKFKQCINRDA